MLVKQNRVIQNQTGLSLDILRPVTANYVKIAKVCVMCIEEHVLVKNVSKRAQLFKDQNRN